MKVVVEYSDLIDNCEYYLPPTKPSQRSKQTPRHLNRTFLEQNWGIEPGADYLLSGCRGKVYTVGQHWRLEPNQWVSVIFATHLHFWCKLNFGSVNGIDFFSKGIFSHDVLQLGLQLLLWMSDYLPAMNDSDLNEERSSSLTWNYQRRVVLKNRHRELLSWYKYASSPVKSLFVVFGDRHSMLPCGATRQSALSSWEWCQPDQPGKDFLSEAKSKWIEEKDKQRIRPFESGPDNCSCSIRDHSSVCQKRLAHLGHVWPDVLINKQLQQQCLLGVETCRVAIKWQLRSISCNLTAAARIN